MRKILLFIAILMVGGPLTAQIKLSGVVKDSIGDPLEMANVIAIDTVSKKMTSYGFTDSKGMYKLNLKKNSIYKVKISYVGMKPADLIITTKESDIVKNVTLAYDNALDEINIVAKMPVTVKGDTIIYNADSYKNGTERKLEDVLKKLPGVEINEDGQIEVEGKTVEKVMVDGKDFFDGDSKLATKNIPSNAVDKIQVLRNFGDVSQLRGVQDNQDRVALNIKLKKGKENFWFGDVTVGAGDSPNEGLYLFQPKLFYYTPKYTLNVIGDLNNIGEVVLNRRDVRNFSGGFRSQSPSNGTSINLASAGIGFLNATARNANRIETQLGALNFSYSPSKKLDLSGFLIWSGNSNGQRNINRIDYVDPDIPDDVTDNTTDQTSNTALLKLSAIYKKDFNNQLNYDVIGRFSNEYRTDNISSAVVGNNIFEGENATPYRVNQNFSYFYTASEKSIFALEVEHVLQDEDPFYASSLENDPTNNDLADNDGFDDAAEELGLDRTNMFYRLNQDRRVKSNQMDAKLDYYYILNDKSNLNFVGGTILSRQNFDSQFFQLLDDNSIFDPTLTIPGVTDPQLTNDTEYNFTDLYVGMRYRLRSGIFTIRPGFTLHSFNINNTQFGTEYFEDKQFRILPEFRVIAQFKRSENLTFSYNQLINFTDVNQIARGIVANNYSSFFFGNSELVNSVNHNLSLDYRSFNLFNNINTFASVRYSKTIDQVANVANFVDGSVISTSSSLNLPFDAETLTAFGFISKTWGKLRGRFRTNYTYFKGFQLFGGNTTEINRQNYTFAPSFNTNFRKAPNVSLRYSVSFSDVENNVIGIANRTTSFNTVTHAPAIEADAYIWNSLTVRSDISFNEVKQDGVVQNTFKIWNFSMGYRKDRDAKWEYEIRANNILGTDSRLAVNNGAISNSINETFILPRFITARVIYSL
jgi:hypothetical protein